MNIGIVVEYLHGRGGTQRQALELARALVTMGHGVVVLTRVLDRGRCFPELLAGLEVRSVHEARGDAPVVPSSALRDAARRISHSAGLHDLADLRTMRRATRELATLVASVHAEHPFDVLNAHDYGPAAWAVAETAGDVAKVWQCNDPIYRWGKAGGLLGGPTRDAAIAYDRRRSDGFDVITVLDSAVARVVEERFGMRPRVVRSGVNVATFEELPERKQARARLGLPQDAFVVLLLALLHSKHRRAEDGIAVAERLGKESQVLLAATVTDPTSDYTKAVEQRFASSTAQDRIVWRRGALQGESELRELFAAADAFLFPNEQQTWGLAVIEACMAGLPVVVSDGAGVHEVLTDGDDGFVYPVGDVRVATERLERLRRHADLRKSMSAAAKTLARSMTWERYATEMVEAFDDARSRRRAR